MADERDSAQGWADLSSLLGSFSTSKQQDRQTVGNQTQNYDQLMLRAQQEGQETEADALKKLAVTNYIRSGGQNYKPATIQFQGGQSTLPSYGFGPRGTSTAQQMGASALEGQLMRRLQPGGTYRPTDVGSYTKQGTAEKIGDIGGLITGGLGAYDTITGRSAIGDLMGRFGGRGADAAGAATGAANAMGLTGAQNAAGINSLGWTLPGASQGAQGAASAAGGAAGGAGTGIANILGKAAPIAGIATGAMGLMKDRGWAGNMASGASTGAGIGSLVAPGIGTAIGAGVGALGGLLRGIGGGPSDTEKAGRVSASQGRSMISSLANPQQAQEAQAAGWENPQDALTYIVLRDRFGEQQASNLFQQLHGAERQGPEAVQQILSMIAGRRA